MNSKFEKLIQKLENRGISLNNYISSNDIENLANDLDIYEAELLAQNEELISKEFENKKLIEKLNVIFQNAPSPYFLLDENLNVVNYNLEARLNFNLNKTNNKNYFPFFCLQEERNDFLDWILKKNFKNETYETYLNVSKNEKQKFKINIKEISGFEEFNYLVSLTSIEKEMKLLNEIKELEENKLKNLKKFIDSLTDIIVLTDGKLIKDANKRLFDFFDYDNLEDFLANHKCICEFFIEDDEFFHLKKIDNNSSWIDYIKKLEPSKRIVSMKSKNDNIHIFGVHINEFSDNLYSIVFSNETSSYLEKSVLKNKVLKDKLTDAYNREFFEIKIDKMINNLSNENTQFTLTMIDIDFFKNVNDTYGHNVGDKVLIELVKLIKKHSRSNDILVRWGGEEFILVMKIENKDSLYKAIENLRITIEMHDFQEIGHLNCSFGGTFYSLGEDILETVSRADKALYISKNNGRNQTNIL